MNVRLLIGLALGVLVVSVGCKGAEAAKEVEAIAGRICECKDVACAKKGVDELTDWQKKHAETKGTEDDVKKIEAAAKKAQDCFIKLGTTLAAPPADKAPEGGDKAPEGDHPTTEGGDKAPAPEGGDKPAPEGGEAK